MSQIRDFWVNPHLDTAQPQGDNPENQSNEASLIELICSSLTILWKERPKQMNCTVLDPNQNRFSLIGVCPHCRRDSVFMIVAGPHTESGDHFRYVYRHCAAMRCQGCLNFILGLVGTTPGGTFEYVQHYPLGAPDDSVDPAVPKSIAADFAEALRCEWVQSHKAAVAMCRRSVEAACKDLGAKGKTLMAKIDNLAEQGKITDPLKRMAHRVRLTANEQLHGDSQDDLDTFGEDDAEAIILCVRQLFHHVYVMPAMLDKYDEQKGGTSNNP